MVVDEIHKRAFVIVGEDVENVAGVYICRRLQPSVVAQSDLLTALSDTHGVVNLTIDDADFREWEKCCSVDTNAFKECLQNKSVDALARVLLVRSYTQTAIRALTYPRKHYS
jgi:hypothetical protein